MHVLLRGMLIDFNMRRNAKASDLDTYPQGSVVRGVGQKRDGLDRVCAELSRVEPVVDARDCRHMRAVPRGVGCTWDYSETGPLHPTRKGAGGVEVAVEVSPNKEHLAARLLRGWQQGTEKVKGTS
jgi:hypothetical protein